MKNWVTHWDTPPSVFDPDLTRRETEATAARMADAVRDQVYGGVVPSVAPVDTTTDDDVDQAKRHAARLKLQELLSQP